MICRKYFVAVIGASAIGDVGSLLQAQTDSRGQVWFLGADELAVSRHASETDAMTPSEVAQWAEEQGHLQRPTGAGSLKLAHGAEGYHSQYPGNPHQLDKYVDELLRHMEGGFVVESGAADGEDLSNSLFFEVSRKWNGLLVEPNPQELQHLLGLNRQMWSLAGGLSTENAVSSFEFVPAGLIGGIKSELGDREMKELSPADLDKTIQVTCYPLHTLLQGIGVKTVDFWSLDTEGSEPAILEAMDFDAIEVGVLAVEHNGDVDKKSRIARRMEAVGFELNLSTFQDDVYVNPSYFKRAFS